MNELKIKINIKITKKSIEMELNETTWSIFDMESTTMMTNIITAPRRHITLASQIILTLVYICGVIGNISALLILFFRDKVN